MFTRLMVRHAKLWVVFILRHSKVINSLINEYDDIRLKQQNNVNVSPHVTLTMNISQVNLTLTFR